MYYEFEDVRACVARCATALCEHKDTLAVLDGYSGDGDLGRSMEQGAHALLKVLRDDDMPRDLGALFSRLGVEMGNAAPSTMGTLMAMALRQAGVRLAGQCEIEEKEVSALIRCMADAIARVGKARLGDKTILDALLPACDALEAHMQSGDALSAAVTAATDVAHTAAEGTRGMFAKVGRARWIGERSSEYLDPGAVMCAILFRASAN